MTDAAILGHSGRLCYRWFKPAIITVTIFNFMSVSGNEFFMALIFTTSDSVTPVGGGLVLLQIVNAMKYSGQLRCYVCLQLSLCFLPTFLLYLFLSEKIYIPVLPVAALRAD